MIDLSITEKTLKDLITLEDLKKNDIYLDLDGLAENGILIKTEKEETDHYVMYVEASNENMDLDGEIVVQKALEDQKDNFMKFGIITWDHQHKDLEHGPKAILGQPIEVVFGKKKTFVKFKLYKDKEFSKELVNMLKSGGNRIRASIGGQVIEKSGKKIIKVIWNELALTWRPANNTLGPIQWTAFDEFKKNFLCTVNGKCYPASELVKVMEDYTEALDKSQCTCEVHKSKNKNKKKKKLDKDGADIDSAAPIDSDARYYDTSFMAKALEAGTGPGVGSTGGRATIPESFAHKKDKKNKLLRLFWNYAQAGEFKKKEDAVNWLIKRGLKNEATIISTSRNSIP